MPINSQTNKQTNPFCLGAAVILAALLDTTATSLSPISHFSTTLQRSVDRFNACHKAQSSCKISSYVVCTYSDKTFSSCRRPAISRSSSPPVLPQKFSQFCQQHCHLLLAAFLGIACIVFDGSIAATNWRESLSLTTEKRLKVSGYCVR